jgi:acetyl-CoA synthetase
VDDHQTRLIAIWRLGAVHVPLFTAFATPAITMRLHGSQAKVVIADADQVPKLDPATGASIIQVGGEPSAGVSLLADLTDGVDATGLPPVRVGGDGTFIMIFTSGTTGTPKGVPVPVRGIASMHGYLVDALDVQDSDVFWNAADPGWAYGLFFALVAPMAMGRPSLLLHAGFSAQRTWQILEQYAVTNLAAAPTIYRSLRVETPGDVSGIRLRRASAAGEPLTPEVSDWSRQTLGLEVRDHYGQTELGMVVANAWREGIREEMVTGSMGVPLPGWSATVLADLSDEEAAPGTVGRLAVDRANSPLMWFTGYYQAPEKTAERLTADGRWYLTGDTARRDPDGRLYFSSRDDDVIIMAGYRIGPFEVESVLVSHPDVVECAVVAAPDELRGEVLEAYVVTRPGVEGNDALTKQLQQLVKTQVAAHAYPRTVRYVDELRAARSEQAHG